MIFSNAQITDEKRIIIPEGVTYIEDRTGADNAFVEEVVFPGSVESIRNNVFSNCPNLKRVVFEHTSKRQNNGSGIFYSCPKLKKVYFADFDTFMNYTFDMCGPLENGSQLYIEGKLIEDFIIPDDLKEGKQYFLRNLIKSKGIKSIKFKDGSDIIGFSYEIDNERSFGTCYGITKAGYEDKALAQYPDIEKNMTIYHFTKIRDIINGFLCHGVSLIVPSYDDFEKICIDSMHSIKQYAKRKR